MVTAKPTVGTTSLKTHNSPTGCSKLAGEGTAPQRVLHLRTGRASCGSSRLTPEPMLLTTAFGDLTPHL